MEERIQTLHPAGKQGVHIVRSKYETVREAILTALAASGRLTFSGLTQAIEERLGDSFEGSIPWYVTTVKLDLEARQLIERVPGENPQQLRLVK